MSDSRVGRLGDRLRRFAVLLLVPAVAAGFAGCTSSASRTAGASLAASGPSARLFSEAKLRDALLTRVNGVAAALPAAVGHYASLAATRSAKPSAAGVRVAPAACAKAALAGFEPAVLAGSPAAAVTFDVGRNAVSEVLVASSSSTAARALARQVPAKCARYREIVDGRTFRYVVKESTIKGIGDQARLLNVRQASAAKDNLWSLVYRGAGFVGSVTVIGANASELAVKQLAEQAYAYAAKSLS